MSRPLKTTFIILLFFVIASGRASAQKPELSVQTGHAAAIVSLAFSSDGKIVASGSVDNTIKLWDPTTGHQLRALKGHEMTVFSVAFSPDDKLIVSGSSDKTIKLWDVASGKEIQTLRGHTLSLSSVAFSPDGKILASGSADQKVKLWDVATGRELRTLLPNIDPNYSVGLRIAFSRDGKTLVSSGEVVKLWDVSSGRELRTIRVAEVSSNPDMPISIPVFPIAISYDGRLATGGKSIKFWDLATGNLSRTLPSPAQELTFSPDGESLAVCDLTDIKVWNVKSGQEVQSWEGPRVGVDVVAFNHDGKILASGNSDNTVRFWDPVKGEELRVLSGYTDSVTAVALSADGKVLANGIIGSIGRTDMLRIWDPTTGQLLRSLIGQRHAAYSIGLSNDGSKLVASGGGNAAFGIWNPSQADQVKKFQAPRNSGFIPSEVTLSGDGRLIASGGRDGLVKLWDVDTGRELFTSKGHQRDVRAIAFSPKGDVFASSSQDTTIKLWSVATGQELKTLRGHAGGVVALAFSPDGKKLVSGSQDKAIFLWDVATGEAQQYFMGHKAWVNAVAFSRDGQKLASGSEDGMVRLWDVATERLSHTLLGHRDRVNSITFSPDSKLLISGSHDTSMKLWDVAAGKELASLFALGQQDWLVITPDGLFDGSPAAWNQILWRFSASLFDVAPVELFFNEYYYPGLLADLYAGKRPLAPQNISQKDRRQPGLKLTLGAGQAAAAGISSRTVAAKIEVGPAPAGAQDVRLFRNGALVKVWRGDVLKGQSRVVLEAQIPIVAGPNRLTAYAFNRDNVKSADATLTVTGDDGLKQAGTLYILAIAVNRYDNPQFDLRYAVADATDFASELQRQEANLKNFGGTEVIPLHDAQATKTNILRAITNLATRVKPEDAVVVYYAGHGTAQQNQFYLIPHDLGFRGELSRIDAAGLRSILGHSISDRELERAFEGVDAGRFLLVIDACNSGQALEAEEKRRGPMNSRGLAQLAYEKGMYVLTAAQSYQAAIEAAKLGHGYLTYALVEEALKTSAADIQPRDGQVWLKEWLDYATQRVPQMQEEKMREGKGRQLQQIVAFVPGEENTDPAKRNLQRPRVFYRRELEADPFIVAKVVAKQEAAPPKN